MHPRLLIRENATWGEDRIAEELRLKLGVTHATSTVRKYTVGLRPVTDPGRGVLLINRADPIDSPTLDHHPAN